MSLCTKSPATRDYLRAKRPGQFGGEVSVWAMPSVSPATI